MSKGVIEELKKLGEAGWEGKEAGEGRRLVTGQTLGSRWYTGDGRSHVGGLAGPAEGAHTVTYRSRGPHAGTPRKSGRRA